jgi:hypothetical protein
VMSSSIDYQSIIYDRISFPINVKDSYTADNYIPSTVQAN